VSIAFSDPSQTERWLQKIVRAEILVIDDIAKRFTQRHKQGAFRHRSTKRALKRHVSRANIGRMNSSALGQMTRLAVRWRESFRDVVMTRISARTIFCSIALSVKGR